MIATRLVRPVTVGLIAVLIAPACSSEKPPSAPPSPTQATASPTVSPTVADAERQARAAYAGYIDAYANASQAADPDNPDLARYVADPLLSLTRHNVRKLKNIEAVQIGGQKATIIGSQVELDATPPKVTLRACLDFTDLKVVYKANQSPVPDFAIAKRRAPAVITVWKYDTGRWLVNASKQGSHPC